MAVFLQAPLRAKVVLNMRGVETLESLSDGLKQGKGERRREFALYLGTDRCESAENNPPFRRKQKPSGHSYGSRHSYLQGSNLTDPMSEVAEGSQLISTIAIFQLAMALLSKLEPVTVSETEFSLNLRDSH